MTNDKASDIDVDALMRQIREEIEQRRNAATHSREGRPRPRSPQSHLPASIRPEPLRLPRLSEAVPPMDPKAAYSVAEFFQYQDRDFIRSAYRALLRREPDAEGAGRFLSRLRAGDLSKVEILGRIRFSPEGRAAAIDVKGLALPFALRTIRRVPVLGHMMGMAQYFVRLPTIVRNHERLESVFFHERYELRHGVNAVVGAIETAWENIERSRTDRLEELQEKLSDMRREAQAARERLSGAIALKAGPQEVDAMARRLRAEAVVRSTEIVAAIEGKLDVASFDVFARDIAAAHKSLGATIATIGERKAEALDLEKRAAELRSELVELESRTVAQTHFRTAIEGIISELSSVGQKVGVAAEDSAGLRQRLNDLGITVTAIGRAKVDHKTLDEERERIGLKVNALGANFAALRRDSLEYERRLALLFERTTAEHEGEHEVGGRVMSNSNGGLDSFYVAFEDVFRGDRADIKQRVAIYLPYIRDSGAGTPAAPVLDIGCGRGEWLELLKDNRLEARGVDSNPSMAAMSREYGVEVTEADAVEYLRGLPPDSIGAVTAIHVIEHVPFLRLMSLFAEVRRVLRPGGVAIFETPNPENLIVGACNFWYDPTHQHPLPPEPMRFVLDNRGFERVEILRLHPVAGSPQKGEGDAIQSAIAARFFGPQDYALVGFKADASGHPGQPG